MNKVVDKEIVLHVVADVILEKNSVERGVCVDDFIFVDVIIKKMKKVDMCVTVDLIFVGTSTFYLFIK